MKITTLTMAALLTALGATAASAQVLYTESFDWGAGANNTTVSHQLQSTTAYTADGWGFYSTASGTNNSNNANVNINDRQSPNNTAASASTGGTGVSQGATHGTDEYGVVVISGASASFGSPWLMETSSLPANISTSAAGLNFSWAQGDAQASDSVQLAIQVGGSWFASTQTFSTTAQNAGTPSPTFATGPADPLSASGGTGNANSAASFFDPTFASLTWTQLNFTPGTTLSLTTTSATPSGTITGIGWLNTVTTQAGNMRFDSVQISETSQSVPEPSTVSFLMAGLAALLIVVNRKRKVA